MFTKVRPERPRSLKVGVPCSYAGEGSLCLSGRLVQMNLFPPFAAFPAPRGEELSGRVQWKAWQQSLGKRTQSAGWEQAPQLRDHKVNQLQCQTLSLVLVLNRRIAHYKSSNISQASLSPPKGNTGICAPRLGKEGILITALQAEKHDNLHCLAQKCVREEMACASSGGSDRTGTSTWEELSAKVFSTIRRKGVFV